MSNVDMRVACVVDENIDVAEFCKPLTSDRFNSQIASDIDFEGKQVLLIIGTDIFAEDGRMHHSSNHRRSQGEFSVTLSTHLIRVSNISRRDQMRFEIFTLIPEI